MIDSKELRICNWVYSKSHNWNYKVILLEYDKELNAKPIPLTEEIIKKCGFNEEPDYDEDNQGNSKSCFYLIIDSDKINCEIFYIFFVREEEGIYIQLNGKDELCGNRFKHIKYLHQLQNLYWCLVGEELNISL